MSVTLTRTPSAAYQAAMADGGALGHTEAWQGVLRHGMGCETAYVWDNALDDGLAITIFKRALFRIGFVGFPFGGTVRGRPLTDEWLQCLRGAQREVAVHALRVIASPFEEQLTVPEGSELTWETAVVDLPSWSLAGVPKGVRYDVRKAAKAGVQVREARTEKDAQAMADLYKATIARQDGNLRYEEAYFQQLVLLAQREPRLGCFVADAEGGVIGFAVTALHGRTAFYLHAGMNYEFQKYRPAYALLAHSLAWGQERGAARFNMMASPLTQRPLARFKEKWGGVTAQQHTFNVLMPTLAGHTFGAVFGAYQRYGVWQNGRLAESEDE